MKQIYRIGTKYWFTYKPIIGKTFSCWVVQDVHYIYASNKDEAVKLHKEWFYNKNKIKNKAKLFSPWEAWEFSNNFDFELKARRVKIIYDKIVFLKFIGNENIDMFKRHMRPENFRDWFLNV